MTSTAPRPIALAPGSPIGTATGRRDGRAKVTGEARYAAEYRPEGLLHAVQVTSTVPAGTLTALDTAQAETMPGVRLVLTHHNADPLSPALLFPFGAAPQSLLPLQDERIRFSGQVIALVVAETIEQATDAASRVRAAYDTAAFVPDATHPEARIFGTEVCGEMAEVVPNLKRGDPEAALAAAPVTLDVTYTSPRQYGAGQRRHPRHRRAVRERAGPGRQSPGLPGHRRDGHDRDDRRDRQRRPPRDRPARTRPADPDGEAALNAAEAGSGTRHTPPPHRPRQGQRPARPGTNPAGHGRRPAPGGRPAAGGVRRPAPRHDQPLPVEPDHRRVPERPARKPARRPPL
ncbi:xanthine dehydrogenase family protein molybdopterin-binding subunit [Kitasatospora aureofaciens]|nr:xanthine dehydrogenase family protein molybdopterin-binding subunit [Kitasatospora aureofaciens]